MYIEEKVKAEMVQEALQKKVVKPSARRLLAQKALSHFDTSISLVCQAFLISETYYRYQTKSRQENQLIADWLIKLTNENSDRGFGLCFDYLRNIEGYTWNHKRVYRIIIYHIE